MLLTRPKLTVSLHNLAQNYRELCKKTQARAGAVVKANAYGLGAEQVVQKLAKEGCDAFFVAHASEGAQIRPVVPNADIFVLQGVGQDNIDDIRQFRLTPVLATPEMWHYWQQTGIQNIRPIIQVETGLNRLGFRQDDLKQLPSDLKQYFSYVLSHLACADEQEHPLNAQQKQRFDNIRGQLSLPATLSASDGVFLGDAYHYDMVRLGAAMYGLNTVQGQQTSLKPVLFVSAPVLQIASIEAGESVGYGASFVAEKPMKIAVISIGYADGLPRCLSQCGHVRLHGIEVPIIGRVSMDNIMCDVSCVPSVQIGDMAHILDDVYRADDMAKQAGTIGYEILTDLGRGTRFCREYKD